MSKDIVDSLIAQMEVHSNAYNTMKMATDEIESLRQQLEIERMRLATCGVVAIANTPKTAAKTRKIHPKYRRASCDDVTRMVDREIESLRQQLTDQGEYYKDVMNDGGKRIADLRQQLAAANMAEEMTHRVCLNLTEKVIPNIKQWYVKQLAASEKREAEAIAACKLKDEALRYMHEEKCDYMRLNHLGNPIHETSYRLAVTALAIQPDDSALKAWLGEPVAWRTFDGEGGYDFRSYDENEDYRSKWDASNPNYKSWVELLYSPKGLK